MSDTAYIGLSISYSELLLIPFNCIDVLPKLQFATTHWNDGDKVLEIKQRPVEFTLYSADQIAVAKVTQKLTGESS